MNETCDRCGSAVRAVYRPARQHSELYLCRHCANRHRPVLSARGWNIGPASGNSPARVEAGILVGD
jgi:ribosome-binding protein aMBF1 (putative translation factor)